MDPAVESLGSSTIGITFPLREYAPRRSDFILYRGVHWRCSEHAHFGETPIKESNGTPLQCDRGKFGFLYPSDHLAVRAQFHRVPSSSSSDP
jgi:hypothetical protein